MGLRSIIIFLLIILMFTSIFYMAVELNSLRIRYMVLLGNYSRLEKDYSLLFEEHNILVSNYSKLESSYASLTREYLNLNKSYAELENTYTSLKSSYQSLMEEYSSLKNGYMELRNTYTSLESSYTSLRSKYTCFLNNYEGWRSYLLSYIFLEESIKRVLCSSEISKLIPLIRSIVSNPKDLWGSIWEIYAYIRRSIVYVRDPPIPIPPPAWRLEKGTYINETLDSIILSPSETLNLKQGDCEDQAILLYAMIKAYWKHIYGKELLLWLMHVTFYDGSRHLAVALPVLANGGRELTILDTAGRYYTGTPFRLTSNNPYTELKKYSEWFMEYGGIKTVTIYNVVDGVLVEVASGGIYEVAQKIK